MFQNQKGFSLIQIMVAGTVMAIMSAGIADMVVQQSRNITYMEDRMSHQNYKKEIEQVLDDNSICEESLKLIHIAPVGDPAVRVNEIKDTAGNIFYSPTDPAKSTYDQIKIDSIKVENISVPGINSSGQIKLVFDIKRLRKGGGGESLKSVEILREVDVNNLYKAQVCRGGADDESGAGSCLESTGGQTVSTYPSQFRVPADVKAIRLKTPGDRVSRGGDNDCSESIPASSSMFILNDKSEVDNVKMSPGGILRFVRSGPRINMYYNNALVGSSGYCNTNFGLCKCNGATASMNQPIITCTKSTDFNQTDTNVSFSYWK